MCIDSQGTPMMLMGDEYGHTRNGNNNSYGHDNHLNWFLWKQVGPALVRFRLQPVWRALG